MSDGWAAVPNDIARDRTLGPYAKLAYLVISSHAGTKLLTELLVGTIAEEASISRSSAKRGIEELVARDYIRVTLRKNGKVNISSVYRIAPVGVAIQSEGQSSQNQGSVLEEPTVGSQGATEEAPIKNHKDSRPTGATTMTILHGGLFDAFWSAYPRKVAKPDAVRSWNRALGKVKAVEQFEQGSRLIMAAEAFARDPNREDAYTPHPSTWLNNERWNDGPLPAKRQGRAQSKAPTTRNQLYET